MVPYSACGFLAVFLSLPLGAALFVSEHVSHAPSSVVHGFERIRAFRFVLRVEVSLNSKLLLVVKVILVKYRVLMQISVILGQFVGCTIRRIVIGDPIFLFVLARHPTSSLVIVQPVLEHVTLLELLLPPRGGVCLTGKVHLTLLPLLVSHLLRFGLDRPVLGQNTACTPEACSWNTG
jgi:hypothetical protein